MTQEQITNSFCLPSSAALTGQQYIPIPLPKPSPYDIERSLPFLNQPMTQPASPRYNHRSPSPHRYNLPVFISIDNYNPRKKQNFTEKYTLEALSILQIDQSKLFIDPQQPLQEQTQRIALLSNEVKQIRNRIKASQERNGRAPASPPSKPILQPRSVLASKAYSGNRSVLFNSRLECIKERNKKREKRAEEIAHKKMEEQLKRQEMMKKQEQIANKKRIEVELEKKRRSISCMHAVDVKVVPIVF